MSLSRKYFIYQKTILKMLAHTNQGRLIYVPDLVISKHLPSISIYTY